MIKTPIIINNSSYEPKEKAPIPFCFFKFKTERERIEKYLNKTPKKKVKRCQGTIINYFRQIDNNIDKREKYTNDSYSISNNMNNNFEYKNNIDEKIIQQSMKYKPRNDLERIMDSITKNKGSIEYKNMEDIRMKQIDTYLTENKKKKKKKIQKQKGVKNVNYIPIKMY